MRPVDVGIRHDDHAAVAQLVAIETITDAAAQRLDQILQLLVLPQLVGRCAGDVEDLAAQRQHRLGFAVARLLGRPAGAVALDQENLRLGGVFARAIGQCDEFVPGRQQTAEFAAEPRPWHRMFRFSQNRTMSWTRRKYPGNLSPSITSSSCSI